MRDLLGHVLPTDMLEATNLVAVSLELTMDPKGHRRIGPNNASDRRWCHREWL